MIAVTPAPSSTMAVSTSTEVAVAAGTPFRSKRGARCDPPSSVMSSTVTPVANRNVTHLRRGFAVRDSETRVYNHPESRDCTGKSTKTTDDVGAEVGPETSPRKRQVALQLDKYETSTRDTTAGKSFSYIPVSLFGEYK